MITDSLATARLTRLVVEDKITEPIRDKVMGRWPDSKVAYLVTCQACVSIWAAAAVLLGGRSRLGRAAVRMLALSEVAIALRAGAEWLETRGSS